MKNIFTNIVLLALLIGTALHASSDPRPLGLIATEQTTTYNNYDDGWYKRGHTHIYSRDSSTGIVTDSTTGLMWQDDGNNTGTMNWTTAETTCDSYAGGGYTDWRLPTVEEFSPLVDASRSDPSIDTTVFQNTASNGYWSSTSYAPNTTKAWSVQFSSGVVYYNAKANSSYVRCVRGNSYPASSFSKSGNIVTDSTTNLQWQDDAIGGTMSWTTAITTCENLTLDGHTDWRLPNRNELQSIVDYSDASAPLIDGTFQSTASSYYWSSSTSTPLTANAWGVYFSDGGVSSGAKANSSYVRCVRDTIPAFSFTDLTGQNLSTTVESSDINLSALKNVNIPISISGTGCLYSINHGTFTDTNGTVSNEQNVTLKTTTSSSYFTEQNCTLTIGGVSDTWSVTTKLENPRPLGLIATGQTATYNNYDDGWYKRGHTHLYSRANDIVTDHTTGLMWRDDANASTTKNTWSDANTTCENMEFSGYNDWRLPTAEELSTLLDANRSSFPNIDPTFQNTASNYYWSSTTSAPYTATHAWGVYFNNGGVNSTNKTNSIYVRCVRGGSLPASSFSKSGNIVTDNTTGLQWQDDTAAATITKTWTNAISTCENLTLDGYSDWRLPNRNELQSIIDYSVATAPLIDSAFQNTASSLHYWSSTTRASGTSVALSVSFATGGGLYDNSAKTSSYYVGCVRDTIPAFSFTDLTSQTRDVNVTSNDFNLSALKNVNVAISISGVNCLYAINNGSFVDTNGTISNDQVVTLQTATASSYSTTTDCNLTIGGISDIWSVTTGTAPVVSSGGGGGGSTGSTPSSYSVSVGGGSGSLNYASNYSSSYVDGARVISSGSLSLTIPTDTSKPLVLSSGSGDATTTLKLPRDANVVLNRDGSFTIALSLSGGGSITLKGGGSDIALSVSNGVINSIAIPKGATIALSSTGAISSLFTLNTPYGIGVAHTLIDPVTNSITTTVAIDGRLYRFKSRSLGSSASIAIFQGEQPNRVRADDELFYGVKSTFTTSIAFILNEENNSTTITPNSSATFEERIYFNGERTITLVDGEASINRDRAMENMKQTSEYLFALDSYTQADNHDAESRYANNTLSLSQGWNLITSPIDEAIETNTLSNTTTWEYEKDTDTWKNPTTLISGKGYWVNSTQEQNIEINGSSYSLDSTNITEGWNLLGAGEEIIDGAINYDLLGVYVYRDYEWILNPVVIYRGEGFWGWRE